MSLASQSLFTNPKNSHFSYFTNTHHFTPLKNPNNLHFLRPPSPSPNFSILTSFRTTPLPLKAFNSENSVYKDGYNNSVDNFNFDTFLSLAEFLCLTSSAVVSIGFAANCAVSGTQKVVNVLLGNKVWVWQVVVLVVGVGIGALIRKRQWRRICREDRKGGVESVNFLGRIEKLEEDIRTSASLIRALSRQLEKLGIRFRLTRKALKEPIAQTAALAQKNSEATRALAAQENILEMELGEIQKVLLAMQEQQQKQLELILAIAKTGKLWENKRGANQEEEAIKSHKSAQEGAKRKGIPLIQTVARHPETTNDRA